MGVSKSIVSYQIGSLAAIGSRLLVLRIAQLLFVHRGTWGSFGTATAAFVPAQASPIRALRSGAIFEARRQSATSLAGRTVCHEETSCDAPSALRHSPPV